jgi:uncharacterized protein with von Willebrand factor type A (vWA) domain
MTTDQRADTFDVDAAALATAVGQRLHQADMEVTPRQSEHYARSLQLAKPSSRRELYHTTRAIFVTDLDQVATFDRVFAEVFGAAADAVASGTESGRAVAHA